MEARHVFWAIIAIFAIGVVLSLVAVGLRSNSGEHEETGETRKVVVKRSSSWAIGGSDMIPVILGIAAYMILIFYVLPNVFPKFWARWYGNPEFFWGTNATFIIGILLESYLKKDIGRWLSIITWLFILAKCIGWACWLC